MKNPMESNSKIPGYTFFAMGVAIGATLGLFFMENTAPTEIIQFQNASRFTIIQQKHQSSRLEWNDPNKMDTHKSSVINGHDYAASEKIRVLCMVMTYHPHHQTRARAVRDTWGRHCDTLIFMSDTDDPSVPTISMNMTGPKRGIWAMSVAAFKYVHEHYVGQFDFLYKCDGDTYAIVESLKKYLIQFSPKNHSYIGLSLKSPTYYMSGGAGYIISSETLKYMVQKGFNGTKYGKCTLDMNQYEDMIMGDCMKELGVPFIDTRDNLGRERFFPEPVDSHTYPYNKMDEPTWFWYNSASSFPTHYGLNCCAEEPISFHHVDYKQMYMMEYMIYHMKQPRPQLLHPAESINKQIKAQTNHTK